MLWRTFSESIVLAISALGYPGIFLLMLIESSILPIPSELALIPAGALVARGQMSFPLLILVSVLGSVMGALIMYSLAYFFGRRGFDRFEKKYGRFMFLRRQHLEKTEKFFGNEGGVSVFIGRFIPVIRHLISIPAGFAKMNLFKFIIYTGIGAGIMSTILIYIGFYISDLSEPLMEKNLELVLVAVILIIIALVTFYAAVRKRK